MKDLSSIIMAATGLLDNKLGNPLTSKFKENKSRRKYGKDNGAKFKSKADGLQSKSGQMNKGCFIYDGLHWAKDCPKYEAPNAIVDDGSKEGSNSDLIKVNLLQLMNAIHVEETLLTRTSDSFGGGGLL